MKLRLAILALVVLSGCHKDHDALTRRCNTPAQREALACDDEPFLHTIACDLPDCPVSPPCRGDD